MHDSKAWDARSRAEKGMDGTVPGKQTINIYHSTCMRMYATLTLGPHLHDYHSVLYVAIEFSAKLGVLSLSMWRTGSLDYLATFIDPDRLAWHAIGWN